MSIEINVIPTSSHVQVWSALAAIKAPSDAPMPVRELLRTDLTLLSMPSLEPIPIGADLSLSFCGAMMLGENQSIGLLLTLNTDVWNAEEDFVEDVGDNLPLETRTRIIHDWNHVGWTALCNVGGVAKYEDPAIGAMLWFGAVFAEHHA